MPSSSKCPQQPATLAGTDVAEPRATLYTDYWREAREHAAGLRPSRGGTVWRRLLEHQERGWEYVRPLALAVEEAKRLKEVGEAADARSAIYRFTDLEIVDLYRFNAFRCADLVLAPYGSDLPSPDDIDGDVDAFYRYVSVLRLATTHRLASAEFRALAKHFAGLDGWYTEFAGVFEPAAEAYYRRLHKLGFGGA